MDEQERKKFLDKGKREELARYFLECLKIESEAQNSRLYDSWYDFENQQKRRIYVLLKGEHERGFIKVSYCHEQKPRLFIELSRTSLIQSPIKWYMAEFLCNQMLLEHMVESENIELVLKSKNLVKGLRVESDRDYFGMLENMIFIIPEKSPTDTCFSDQRNDSYVSGLMAYLPKRNVDYTDEIYAILGNFAISSLARLIVKYVKITENQEYLSELGGIREGIDARAKLAIASVENQQVYRGFAEIMFKLKNNN